MKNKILLFSVAIMMVISLVIASCAAPAPTPAPAPAPAPKPAPAPAPAPKPAPITLKMLTFAPKYPAMDMGFEWFDKVQERAKGELIIRYVGGPEVISGFDQIEAVRKGIVDLAFTPATYAKGIMPETMAHTLSEVAAPAHRETGFFDLMNEIYKKHNLYYIGNIKSPAGFMIYPNVMLEKPEDLEGLKLRTSPLYVPLVEHWGGVPVSMPGGDIYTGMERGVLDGFCWTLSSKILSAAWFEVTQYFINHPFGEADLVILISLDTWNKLPTHLQTLMVDTMAELERDWEPKWEQRKGELVAQFIDKGMEPIEFAPADAERYVRSYFDATWPGLVAKSPTYGPRLRELSKK